MAIHFADKFTSFSVSLRSKPPKVLAYRESHRSCCSGLAAPVGLAHRREQASEPAAGSLSERTASPLQARPFHHVHYRKRDIAFQRDLKMFHSDIASLLKELHAGQRGAHLKTREPCRTGGRFASVQQQGANALARPVRMNKECANFCGITGGIKQVILAIMPAVAAKKRLVFAPAATRDDDRLLPIGCHRNGFNQQICAIANEL